MATEDNMPKSAALREALERAKQGGPTGARLLTVHEACRELRISRWMLYHLIKKKELESIKIGKRRLIPADAIDEYVKRLRKEGQDQTI